MHYFLTYIAVLILSVIGLALVWIPSVYILAWLGRICGRRSGPTG